MKIIFNYIEQITLSLRPFTHSTDSLITFYKDNQGKFHKFPSWTCSPLAKLHPYLEIDNYYKKYITK